jgi:ABC-type dipeptide/oligopeptide/nickel transport system permease component
MTILLMTLSFIVGAWLAVWLAWRYENILDDFIEHFKTIYHGKEK